VSVHTGPHQAPEGVATLNEHRRRSRHNAEDFVTHAISICEREGAAAVTARRIAKEMGLSAMALYRHFSSMDHLLAVVWNEGFAQLLAVMNVTSESHGGGLTGFRASLRAYVRFGIDNPGLYRFMFTAGARPEDFGLENYGLDAMRRLREMITSMRQSGEIVSERSGEMEPIFIWFMLHGLTTVAISGQAQKVSDLGIDDLIERTTERILECL
jgi:AcrR family transcriptional regulator